MDKEVLELDRTRRLQEIQARLDPRAQAEVQGGGVFRGGELLRRRLLHEGTLLWKVQGSRMKGRKCHRCINCSPAVMSQPVTSGRCSHLLTSCCMILSRCAGPADVRHLGFPSGERSEVHLCVTGESRRFTFLLFCPLRITSWWQQVKAPPPPRQSQLFLRSGRIYGLHRPGELKHCRKARCYLRYLFT